MVPAMSAGTPGAPGAALLTPAATGVAIRPSTTTAAPFNQVPRRIPAPPHFGCRVQISAGLAEKLKVSVSELDDHREVIRAPHAVEREVARHARLEHVTRTAEQGLAHHHVVDATFEIERRRRERVAIRPGVSRIRVARRLPCVAKHHTRY